MRNIIFTTLSFLLVVLSAFAFKGDDAPYRTEYTSVSQVGLEGLASVNDERFWGIENSGMEWVAEPLASPSTELTTSLTRSNEVLTCSAGDIDNDGVCDDTDLCTDVTACNYDGSAVNELCDYELCAGCMSQLACNFESTATLDDGSCVFANEVCSYCSWDTLDASSINGQNPQDGSGTLIVNNADGDLICDLVRPVTVTPDTLDNCFDTDKCNYANLANESCTLHTEYFYDADEDSLGEYSLGFFCGDEVPTETPYTD
ncbi:MAG: hypothetical protein CMD33_02640, partial [Flavobacteriales bacterium]|nr:hypothetical protein [Flavobacteriales bacterium]